MGIVQSTCLCYTTILSMDELRNQSLDDKESTWIDDQFSFSQLDQWPKPSCWRRRLHRFMRWDCMLNLYLKTKLRWDANVIRSLMKHLTGNQRPAIASSWQAIMCLESQKSSSSSAYGYRENSHIGVWSLNGVRENSTICGLMRMRKLADSLVKQDIHC